MYHEKFLETVQKFREEISISRTDIKKSWEDVKESYRTLKSSPSMSNCVNWTKDFTKFYFALYIGLLLRPLLPLIDFEVEVLREFVKIRKREPRKFWSIIITYILLVVSLILFQLFPELKVALIVFSILTGLSTVAAPFILFSLLRQESITLPFFLVAFATTAVAPIFFFGSIYFIKGMENLWESFYFSTTTFVTVGFTDSPVSNSIQRAMVGLEGFLGYLYLGIFIAAIPRFFRKPKKRKVEGVEKNYQKERPSRPRKDDR